MDSAVTLAEFDAALRKLGLGEARPKIAVAVSGGGDSLALALLMQDWVRQRGGEMLALTVDHRLRPESTAEALKVREILKPRGIAHDILTWEGGKPQTHVQELAREARYALLLQACRERGFPALALGHNLEDQVETFWMRLAHGSGLDGLASMAPVREREGVRLIRPVLSFTRAQLRDVCAQHGVGWIEDPANRDEKYLRARLRPFETLLAEEGLTPQRLAQTLQKLEDAREALQGLADQTAAACLHPHPEGYAELKMDIWRQAPRDIQRRVLQRALAAVSPDPYPPGFEALEDMRQALFDSGFSGRTLAGCEVFPHFFLSPILGERVKVRARGVRRAYDSNDARTGLPPHPDPLPQGGEGEKYERLSHPHHNNVLFTREPAAVEGRVPVREGLVWDGRFVLSGVSEAAVEIGALEESGLSQLRKNKVETGPLPFKVKRTLPALWQGENLLSVPHVSYRGPHCPPAVTNIRVTLVKIV